MSSFSIFSVTFLLTALAAYCTGQSTPICSKEEPQLCGTTCYSSKVKQHLTPLTVLPSTAVEVPNYEAALAPASANVKLVKLPCAVDRRVCLMYCMLRSDCKWVMFQAGSPASCVGIPSGAEMQFKRTEGAWLLAGNAKPMTVIGEVDFRGYNIAIDATDPSGVSRSYVKMPSAEKNNCHKLCSFHAKCTVALFDIDYQACLLKDMTKELVKTKRVESKNAYTAVIASFV